MYGPEIAIGCGDARGARTDPNRADRWPPSSPSTGAAMTPEDRQVTLEPGRWHRGWPAAGGSTGYDQPRVKRSGGAPDALHAASSAPMPRSHNEFVVRSLSGLDKPRGRYMRADQRHRSPAGADSAILRVGREMPAGEHHVELAPAPGCSRPSASRRQAWVSASCRRQPVISALRHGHDIGLRRKSTPSRLAGNRCASGHVRAQTAKAVGQRNPRPSQQVAQPSASAATENRQASESPRQPPARGRRRGASSAPYRCRR